MKTKTRGKKFVAALLTMVIMLGLFAAFPLTASAATIFNVAATVTDPVIGASPKFTAVSDDSSNYTATVIAWLKQPGDIKLTSQDKFVASADYDVWVSFVPVAGNMFSMSLSATINDESADKVSTSSGSPGAVVFKISFSFTYTVSLNKNGGTGGTNYVSATYGMSMPSINTPTRTGYSFEGYWDTSASSGGTRYYLESGDSARTWNKYRDATLYARWVASTTAYLVTVKNGTGGGSYTTGNTVNIKANAAPAGKVFDKWTASGVTLSNPGSANTSFKMPSNPVTVTATYKDAPPIITQHPKNVTITEGQNAEFKVAASGTAPLSYQWQKLRKGTIKWQDISTTDSQYSGIKTSTLTKQNITTASDGNRYRCVVSNAGGSVNSNYVTLTVKALPTVATPSNLTATASASSITLTWTDNSNNETGFIIERKEGGGGWGQMDHVNANVTTYTDTNVQAGKTYTYKVNAVISGTPFVSSGYSNESSATMAAAKYAVSVNSGAGGGSYSAGQIVTITANAAPSGKAFDKWTTSSSGVTFNSAASASTTFTMPSNAVTVAATYKDLPPSTYAINVTNSGNGTANANPSSAASGVKITLTATPDSGYVFKEWKVTSGGVTVAGNQFTMPASNVTVMAVFDQVPASPDPATTTPPASGTPAPGDSTPTPGNDNTPTPGDDNTPAPGDVTATPPDDNDTTPIPGDNDITPAPGDVTASNDDIDIPVDETMPNEDPEIVPVNPVNQDGEDEGGFNLLWIALIALVVVSVGGGTAFLVMRKKDKR